MAERLAFLVPRYAGQSGMVVHRVASDDRVARGIRSVVEHHGRGEVGVDLRAGAERGDLPDVDEIGTADCAVDLGDGKPVADQG